jgi:glyoxylase-like metal-dependent hydrolase (beta-lactamase superfamily II)
LIVLIALSALLALGGGAFAWVMAQFKDLRPAATARLSEALFVIRGAETNMYLVKGESGYIAFDAGDDAEAVSKEMSILGIAPGSVRAVFLTHSDYDHVSSLPLFRDAMVFIPSAEKPYIDGSRKRRVLGLGTRNSLPVASYRILDPGSRTAIDGLLVEAFPVPGHTAGSTAYKVGDILFAGDMCTIVKGSVAPPVAMLTEDRARAGSSIRYAARIPGVSKLCTGHSGFSADAAAAFAEWL